LAKEFGIDMGPKPTRVRLLQETIDLVVSYYEREDIARWTPGRKETITLRVDGKKVVAQKRYLVSSLHEVYAMFKNEYGKLLSFSKFCDLRPPTIVPYGLTPLEACCCLQHMNFKK
jgi:hypothetical protein